jgi:hypothetical protein
VKDIYPEVLLVISPKEAWDEVTLQDIDLLNNGNIVGAYHPMLVLLHLL